MCHKLKWFLQLGVTIVAMMCFIPAQRLTAQVVYGSINGYVTDQSGAAVPGAQVTIVNENTGLKRATTTGTTGGYSLPSIVPGSYSISVKKVGFKPETRTHVTVTPSSSVEANFKLEVGSVTQQITVKAAAQQLQTTQTNVQGALTASEVNTLPLNGYMNFQSLLRLTPGVTYGNYSQGFQNALGANPDRSLSMNVNGANRNNNLTLVDGVVDVNVWLPHHAAVMPSYDTIGDVNISTNNFTIQQGEAGGAVVTVVTKSGTNQFHGDAYELHEDNALRARNFFEAQRGKSIMNIGGVHIGGPIKKNKLFFFGGWQGLYERDFESGLFTVPTPALREGDFRSALGDYQCADGTASVSPCSNPVMVQTTEGSMVPLQRGMIFDPATGNPDGSGRQVFSTGGVVNIIPQSRMSAAAEKMLALVPMPNRPGQSSNYYNGADQALNMSQWLMKVDWDPAEKLHMFFKYQNMRSSFNGLPALGAAQGPCLCAGGLGLESTQVQEAAVGGSLTLSPNFVIDSTLGFNRQHQDGSVPLQNQNFGSDVLGIPGTNGGSNPLYGGMPMFSISGYTALGETESWNPYLHNQNTYSNRTNANYLKGNHQIQFGVDFNHFYMNHWQPEIGFGPRGGFDFGGGITALNSSLAASPNQFNSLAAFALGMDSSTGRSVQYQPGGGLENEWGLYVGDTWRFTPRLTLNYGVRYELYPFMTRFHGVGVEVYDPTTNKIYLTGVGNIPQNEFISTSKKLFAPRLGIAYRVTSNIVVRSGYGITYDPMPLLRPFRGFFPETIASDFSAPNGYTAFGTLDPNSLGLPHGIPDIITPEVVSGIQKGVLQTPLATEVRTPPKGQEYKRGYIQSWNFIVQGKLPGGFTGSVGYVGSQTVHQIIDTQLNAGTVGGGQASEPLFQAFGRTASTLLNQGSVSANYNALQATLRHTVSHGLTVQAAYTYSKAIDLADDDGWQGLMFNAPGTLGRNRADAGYNVPQIFNWAVIYQLPFGKGTSLLNNNSLAAKLAGGWQLTSVFTARSGMPFTVGASGASLNAPFSSQTADQVKADVRHLGGIGPGQPYYDPSAFAPVTQTRFGTSGRNILRGPSLINDDFGLLRTFKITERFSAQFRAEALNVSNTPHFTTPNGNVSSGNFMDITSAATDERQFRFGLRIDF